jgi:hypothetical protein
MKRFYILLLLLVGSWTIQAQTPTQTIRGTVSDAATAQTLVGATVEVIASQQLGVTDQKGAFRLTEVPVGRQVVQISYVGYESILLPILLESGRETVLNIELSTASSGLDTVVVRSPRASAVQPLSAQTITIEETFRYPATFYDPARMMALYPGVVNVNNQGNAISVRGNSPNFNQWRLEGVEIVNPNHTPNAGTFSDRITQSAGGVNILSAQLLDYSTFLTSAYQAQYGNALGGILDMRLRDGNAEQHEFVGQIGLIGIDVAAEGPLSRKSGASYLANYRYSTIGLLSDLGVNVGDEDISFQDLSVNLSFPTQKAGDFTLFGIWGASDNIFITDRDSTLWEENKDQFDIIFDSETTIVGGTHQLQIGDRGLWKTSVAVSELKSGREQKVALTDELRSRDQERYQKNAFHSRFSYQINSQHTIQVGTNITQHQSESTIFDQSTSFFTDDFRSNTAFDAWLLQPYVSWHTSWNARLSSTVGLTYSRFTFNEDELLEPRLQLSYQLDRNQGLHFAYGLHSQIQPTAIYGVASPQTRGLTFNKAHHLVAGYQLQLTNSSLFKAEVYYQRLYDLPTLDGLSIANQLEYSIADLFTDGFETRTFLDLDNLSGGENYGVELSFQKVLLDDTYLLANVSLFESLGELDGFTYDTRWNGNYALNATGGKEWKWQKKERQMILGLNLNVASLGGFREQSIDLERSRIAQTTIFEESEGFSINQPNFFKTDFRIYYKRNKSKYNTTLALDIQNLTNAQNVAFSYYDSVQDEILTQFQLGLIPILTWRIEF